MSKKTHKPLKKQSKETYTDEYRRFFGCDEKYTLSSTESLEQPSAYKIVKTVTTYGAYEEPI